MSRPLRQLAASVAIAASVACAAAPSSAVATPRTPQAHHDLFTELKTTGSHRWEVTAYTFGSQRVTLLLQHFPLNASYGFNVTYETKGHVTRRRLVANFGKVGRISLRFHPQSHETEFFGGSKACRPTRSTEEFGVYRGTIHIDGERGFTRIHSSRARGKVTTVVTPPCGRRPARTMPRAAISSPAPTHRAPSDADEILAVSTGEGRNVGFGAVALPDLSGWAFEALVAEQRGRISIEREAFGDVGDNAVLLTKPGAHPASARVTGQPPFHGTAAYLEEPTPPAFPWEGTLSVSLPGIDPVPLAGEGFEAAACIERNFHLLYRCQEKLLEANF